MNVFIRFLLAMGLLGILMISINCECPQPNIESMTPSSGPGGTIVEVVYSGGGISGTIVFDGANVETRTASNLGLGKILRFTVPYNATAGNKNVQVRSEGGTSPAVAFNVTGTGTVPTPVLDGFAISNADGSEITVFGSGFSTLSQVFIDGTEVNRYAGNSDPIRVLPFDFVDNAIICQPATNLNRGSSYDVQVTNPGGVNSNILNITVPNRVCKMEFDALENIPVPDYYVWQNNTVNTFRRTYTECGWIIELAYGDTAVVDPQAGSAFSYADLYSFWQANANEPASGYYMHGAFVTDGPAAAPRGVMFMNTGSVPSLPAADFRQGFACFWDDFAVYADRPQKYFRTTLHEAGHGFNLYHSDQSANQTVMTATNILGAGWHCFFSNTSCTHLESHSLTDVAPGGTAFGSRTCH
jgi:hypothetical protein